MSDDEDVGFAELWVAYYDDVLGYAVRRVDRETAREVAAETFLVAWRRRADIPADRAFPWLLAVARNVLANEARSRRRQGRLWGRLRDRDEGQSADVAAGLVEGGRIGAALRRLSAQDREALQLIGWEGLDPKDAAVVAGCSAATFSVRLHRARKRLSAQLAEIDAEDHHVPFVMTQRSQES